MIRMATYITLTFFIIINACTQPNSNNNQKIQKDMENPFPFQLCENNGHFTITAAKESEELFSKYNPLFEKYGYEGNGYCWEGHIIQILEQNDKELLSHIDFDPEAGAFYAYLDSKESQIRFINILSPIFSDLEKLEDYIKKADRKRIDD